jgi:hypothetical protein
MGYAHWPVSVPGHGRNADAYRNRVSNCNAECDCDSLLHIDANRYRDSYCLIDCNCDLYTCCDCDSYTDSYSYCHCHRHCYSYGYCYCYRYSYSYCYCYRDTAHASSQPIHSNESRHWR